MIIENTNVVKEFSIIINDQYFEILAIQISQNKIIIIEKETGAFIRDAEGELLKIHYSSYDETDAKAIFKFGDPIVYRSIHGYLKTNSGKEFYSEIYKSFPSCCEFTFFYFIDNNTGESIKLGYYKKRSNKFYRCNEEEIC